MGINLLREGLDIPEVALVAVLDADREGFLRSTRRSLVQTIGRAARNVEGRAILYGDKITPAMDSAITETRRRREIQEAHNKEHGITPETIRKSLDTPLAEMLAGDSLRVPGPSPPPRRPRGAPGQGPRDPEGPAQADEGRRRRPGVRDRR